MARNEIRIMTEAFPELLHRDTQGMMTQTVAFQVTDVGIV